MKKIYLAAPFTHKNFLIVCYRFFKTSQKCAQLMKEGNIVMSPITHNFFIFLFFKLPIEWDFWEKSCESYLDWCDEMYVFRLKGWTKSIGVNAEIDYIKSKGKPITYIL